ncbi:hypothetical protein B0H10DRAFT_2384429 [Mycena sp. CBHHK59/15]|nr:hypothetical protein B0H10DRAFT_2384429 [Mycena sp. CBHHK59/15]
MVWEALAGSSHITELAQFAIIILQIVANQAGCERTFSRTKIEQSDHRVCLGLDKIEKRTKICAEIRAEHIEKGLYKPRKPRKNHKSTATLLSVPRYQDLLGDQDDEDPTERGRALVSSVVGWRMQMAKWIGDARAAEQEETEEDSEDEETPLLPNRPRVRKIFDAVQEQLSKDRLERVVVLADVVANLTRWTTHCIEFLRLLFLREYLQFAVLQSRGAIIAAQVGAAKSTEAERLKEEAIYFCDLISDAEFWSGLTSVVEDIEPICYGTNITRRTLLAQIKSF